MYTGIVLILTGIAPRGHSSFFEVDVSVLMYLEELNYVKRSVYYGFM